jgi:quercetin dioxygenase-like cupin family protein
MKGESDEQRSTGAVVVDVGSTDTRGRPGAVWSLAHGGDLDANLVHLDPGGLIAAHTNDEVDVMILVIAGRGQLCIDSAVHSLRGDVLALVPKGSPREIRAGDQGITYLTVHRRRAPLRITTPTEP